MSEQLNINPEMDKLARDNGLGHWSCVSPLSNLMWVRSDGVETIFGRADCTIANWLSHVDNCYPKIGKDWQQPTELIADWSHFNDQQKAELIDDLKANSRLNRDFKPTIEPVINHQIPIKLLQIALGVLNQFAIENDSTRAIKTDIENYLNDCLCDDGCEYHCTENYTMPKKCQQPTLVQKPFKYPCDGALYFTKKNHFQVFITDSNDDAICGENKNINGVWDAKTGELLVNKNVFHNDDLDLIMFVWE